MGNPAIPYIDFWAFDQPFAYISAPWPYGPEW